jgi:Cu+-exporting ATPase
MRQWLGIVLLALGVAVWPPATHAQMDHGTMSIGAARVEVATTPAILEPRQPATLTLTLKNAQTGDLVGDLRLAHQRLVHLVVVSEDLATFDHVHPDPAGRGVFRLSYTFPAAGTYYLHSEFTSASLGAQTDTQRVVVAGPAPAPARLVAGPTSVAANSADVQLTADPAQPRVGQPTRLSFEVTQDGLPLGDLQPYLGVPGHLIAVSQDGQEFVHTHADAAGAASDPMGGGMNHGVMDQSMMDHAAMPALPATARFGPVIAFTLTFQQPGLHKVWAQFSRDGDVVTAPFVVDVAP